MGITELLTALKTVLKKCVGNMRLEVSPDTGDYEEVHNLPLEPEDGWKLPKKPEEGPEGGMPQETEAIPEPERKMRAPDVYLMKMPEPEDYTSRVPYLILQFLKIKDKYDKEEKDRQSTADVRVLIAIYASDGQDGGLKVLEIIERIRYVLQTGMLLDGNYMLQRPFEAEVYPDDTGNYFLGEIDMTWSLPGIERTEFQIEDVRGRENT